MEIEQENLPQKSLPAARGWLPGWAMLAIPLAALALMVLLFRWINPLALFTANLPPVESLSFGQVRVVNDGFALEVINSGPEPVQVAQVQVDDAYWQFTAQPAGAIPRFGRADLFIPYPWVAGEPHILRLVTATGLVFDHEVAVATPVPRPGVREFSAYGLLGVYVGVIPVALGLLWFPAMRRMGRRWLGALLALTLGLLVFLLVDTFFEVLEIGAELPGMFQGIPLALFAALLTWLAITAVGSMRRRGAAGDQKPVKSGGLALAVMIAISIGLHNFGEGLAVGAAFALGEAALGSFLVIGFILHNVTEGIGIAAPLVPSSKAGAAGIQPAADVQPAAGAQPAPGVAVFAGLALLAGLPAVLGAWLGGFAFSPLLGVIFLGVGLGAIWQVIVEVTGLLRRYAERDGLPFVSWLNLGGFVLGLAVMYLTAFLVKF